MKMNTAGDSKPESKGSETKRTISLSTPVQNLPFIGQQKAALLEKLGVRRVVDLLFFFPRSYQDVAPVKKYQELQADVACSLLGTIESVDLRAYPDGRSSFGALLAVEGGGYVRLVWYNQPFRQKEIERGGRLIATGVPKPTGISWEMRHPICQSLGPDETPPPPKPQAIYPLTEGLQQRHLRSMIAAALEHCLELIPESLPESLRSERKLAAIGPALTLIHQPNSLEEAEQARYRFTFQELLVYQLAIAWRRHHLRHEVPAQAFVPTGVIHARILQRLGLDLTNDQQKAIDDIGKDMSRTIPMNRLVQGDVGSGKTVVAQYGMLLAVAYRSQVAFMAPTEILAIQHQKRLAQSLANTQCHVELLTGSVQGRERRELLERIALGTVDIVVGTHALLSEKVDFANLGLVVIDEQHKFGVAQRAALGSDQSQPHYFLLSATPIPRTLTMTAMGDMDVSILREKPPGRAPVHTYLGKTEQMTSWWSFVLKQVNQGRQAYIVVPRVVGDEEEDIKGAEQVFKELQSGPLAGLRMSLLHGRMDSEQKALVLSEFAEGQTQVLVATTVIEVGIDIANATVMTILDADRLGLAQLHQLRGRVSRGTTPGYVCVFAKSGASPDENARLNALADTDDGFRLAELDWSMRGPGSLLGTRQSGLPPFKIADLVRDAKIAEETHQVARAIIETDPTLASPEWTRIREQLMGKHGNMLEFGGVG